MEGYQEVMVTLSESVMKMCVQRPLAEDWRWRHIRLAIKHRYLGNLTSQIKRYYGSVSGSHGRSFRIRHEKLRAALPGGEITMTSYPACNKTSLSRKPFIPQIKSYYGTLLINHGRSFSLLHEFTLLYQYLFMAVVFQQSKLKQCTECRSY